MLIGEPAVGKSTLMKKFMERMGNWMFELPKYVPHHLHVKNGELVVVIGNYSDPNQKFPGTDRMSMAAQPPVIQFIDVARQQNPLVSFFFEGDRLGNRSMIEALQGTGIDLAVVRIITSNWVAKQRERASQTDRFRASRKTKIMNLQDIAKYTLVNDSPGDAETIVEWLVRTRL